MTTVYANIEKSINTNFQALVSSAPLTFPVGYIGQELTDDLKGDGLWCQLHNLTSSNEAVTIGPTGEDEVRGILQIDLNRPMGYSHGEFMDYIDTIANYFTIGKVLAYNSVNVRVLNTQLSPGRRVGGYYRLSLSVTYYVRTIRNL